MASAFQLTSSPRFSILFTPPSVMASAWDSPSVDQLSKRMGAAFGRRTTPTEARHFISPSRQRGMKHRLAPRCIDETLPAVIHTKTTSRKPQPPKRDVRVKLAAHRLCFVVSRKVFHS